MQMPMEDRALLVCFSLTCQLERRSLDAGQVIACLKMAADDPDALLPKSVTHTEAPARLLRLLPEPNSQRS